MKLNELAEIMGKTREEVEEIFNKQDIVEINLEER